MSGLTEIHSRINSIKDILKITNAMYLISSSKMKKARKSLIDTEPYFDKLQSTINDILLRTPHMHHVFFERREHIPHSDKKRGYIVITGDKGLAGSYNHNVIHLAEEELKTGNNNYLFLIGQTGRNYFQRKNVMIDGEFLYTAQDPSMCRAREIADTVINLFQKGLLDEVYIIFTLMITPMKAEAKVFRLLPLVRRKQERREKHIPHAAFSPSPEVVMEHLVPNYLKGLIFGILVESYSSEQYSRMVAMEAATSSAKDMMKDLDLIYNRARQSAITQEITEIIGGANGQK